MAVGDGANDLLMLNRSGFGVAFNGKPKLQENVSHHPTITNVRLLDGSTTLALLYYFTFSV